MNDKESWINANLTGEQRTSALAAIRGIKLPQQTKGKNGSGNIIKPTDVIKAYTDVRESIRKEIDNLMNIEGSDSNKETQERLKDLRGKLDYYDNVIQGIGGWQEQQEVRSFTGDWNEDKAIVEDLRQEGYRRGLTWQQIKEAVYKQMLKEGLDEKYARGAAGLD